MNIKIPIEYTVEELNEFNLELRRKLEIAIEAIKELKINPSVEVADEALARIGAKNYQRK